jgi:hypothetical protein
MEKYQAFWPLPGGTEKFVDTLNGVLVFIKENKPTEEELANWFVRNYKKVSAGGSTRGYIRNTLWHSGLVYHDKGHHFLTKAGEEYLTKPDNFLLFRTLDENVLGFRETLQIISESEPSMEQLGEQLTKRLSMGWRKAGQPNWRVSWLRSMGFVTREDRKFKLTETGAQLLKSLPQAPESEQQIKKVENQELVKEEVPVILSSEIQAAIKNLQDAQHDSQNPSRFEEAIAQAFDLLGFSSEWLGKPGDTDVFAIAHLGEESYSIIIDGKTTQGDRIIERQINWPSLSGHRKARSADYTAVVGPAFASGDLLERAQEYAVSLIDTETLIELLEIHDKTPLDLDNLRELFERKGAVRLEDCSDLMTSKTEYDKQQKLIPGVLESLYQLQRKGEPTHASDIRWTMRTSGMEFDREDILETLDLLEKWRFVKRVGGDWIVLMSPRIAARRFRAISESFREREIANQ